MSDLWPLYLDQLADMALGFSRKNVSLRERLFEIYQSPQRSSLQLCSLVATAVCIMVHLSEMALFGTLGENVTVKQIFP